jgi:cell fate regulator YaaT (PSP1 superfamily)
VPDTDSFQGTDAASLITAIELQTTGHLFNYLSAGYELPVGTRVVVEADTGNRIGTVVVEPHEPAGSLDLRNYRRVVRIANDDDLSNESESLDREARARRLCIERIRERGLTMKLVSAEYSLDGRKALFYFVSEIRVDFRDLVRDLANTLRVRVEMKQIGARDESKVTGALGPCGRELCCSSFLRDFEAVTVKMAREQGLALNPSRLAGMCGRLKCCLRYEYATYSELKRALPNLGKRVQSVHGDGKVIRQNILKQTVVIALEGEGGQAEATLADLVARKEPL